jgi:hypothetical protein
MPHAPIAALGGSASVGAGCNAIAASTVATLDPTIRFIVADSRCMNQPPTTNASGIS